MADPGIIEAEGVVAVVRLDDCSCAVDLAEALVAGGVRAIEFTFTNPAAARAMETVSAALRDRALIGAGSVLDPETARVAILAGAAFVVTPTLSPATIQLCIGYGVPTVIGALTPTETLAAWQAGASYVKVLPARLGGPEYVKDVLGPLPEVKLVPTGGVGMENAGAFIKAGSVAVAVGGNLVNPQTVAAGDWEEITTRGRLLVAAVREARRR